MPSPQIIIDDRGKPTAVFLKNEEFLRLKKLEEEKEYFHAISENPNSLKTRPASLGSIREITDSRMDIFSALSHLIGTGLSIAGLVILLVESALHTTAMHVISFSVFGASLILLYLTSSLYHLFPYPSRVKNILGKIDQSMIYLLIAGTYTPICQVVLRGWLGWTILAVIWAFAVCGIIIRTMPIAVPDTLSVLTYIFMGWIIAVALVPLSKALPLKGILWLIAGGVIYTLGTIFYLLDKKFPLRGWFNFHGVFHLFILAGSFCHFWLMLKYIMAVS